MLDAYRLSVNHVPPLDSPDHFWENLHHFGVLVSSATGVSFPMVECLIDSLAESGVHFPCDRRTDLGGILSPPDGTRVIAWLSRGTATALRSKLKKRRFDADWASKIVSGYWA